jgi:hypothetical protein
MKIKANDILEICEYMEIGDSDTVDTDTCGQLQFTVVGKPGNDGATVIRIDEGDDSGKMFMFHTRSEHDDHGNKDTTIGSDADSHYVNLYDGSAMNGKLTDWIKIQEVEAVERVATTVEYVRIGG